MAANTAAIRVGRLLEIRADAGYRTVADVDALFNVIASEVGKVPATQKHVTVVDWRRCPVMSPVAAECIGQRIGSTNTKTERSAALAVTNAPVAILQFLRVIREAGLPDRRLFFSADELVIWLNEVLTPNESARLSQFLTER
jgi:hypothetical protein